MRGSGRLRSRQRLHAADILTQHLNRRQGGLARQRRRARVGILMRVEDVRYRANISLAVHILQYVVRRQKRACCCAMTWYRRSFAVLAIELDVVRLCFFKFPRREEKPGAALNNRRATGT